ncbi:MAG: cytochrome c, partial [Maribacter sp.]|nr:cytochrome c [Maribacter sp.]
SRVRLETIAAVSWLDKETGLDILNEVIKKPLDEWMEKPLEASIAHLNGHKIGEGKNYSDKFPDSSLKIDLKGMEKEQFSMGSEIYEREGFCSTCHQPDGKGLVASEFPPLAGSEWVVGNEDRLIKLTINGMMGPIEVLGKKYPGQVPMTPFGSMLNDEEIASVLTYVRNAFGNKAPAVSQDKVKEIRDAIKGKEGFYSSEELLKAHPMK